MARPLQCDCPTCGIKGRIVTAKKQEKGTDVYCQCMNLNCSKVYVLLLSFSHYTQKRPRKSKLNKQSNLTK